MKTLQTLLLIAGLNAAAAEAPRASAAPWFSNCTPYRLHIPAEFPKIQLPVDNPITEQGVWLGALLFFDPRLSANDMQSCGSCHRRGSAFADPGRALSRGADGGLGTRNTMPLLNLAWKDSFFWHGRTGSLREQVLEPIQNPMEMHASLDRVVRRLAHARVNPRHEARASLAVRISGAVPANEYSSLFKSAFGITNITAEYVALALEQFLLAQISCDSKFDRVLRGESEFSDEEKLGHDLFFTEYEPARKKFGADCFRCHNGPLLQTNAFFNNGLDAEFKDLGRFQATKQESDKGKFAVPSLRNVAVTAPYMHDGRFGTLEAVVEHYASGVKASATLAPVLANHPNLRLPLTPQEKRALVAFLKTLTDPKYLE